MSLREQVSGTVAAVAALARAGVVSPARPDRLLAQGTALLGWGPTLVGAWLGAAARAPERSAVVDDEETVSFAELIGRSADLAASLREQGVREGDAVAIALPQSAAYVVALLAVGLVGADAVLLNTSMPQVQIDQVLADQGVSVVLDDATPRPSASRGTPWPELPSPPSRPGRLVVLTSGTTGPPKGARRPTPKGLAGAAGLLAQIPLRAEGTTLIAAPLFHTWGVGNLQIAGALRSTVVLTRRFTPERFCELVAQHRVDAAAVVPVMLQRLVAAPDPLAETGTLQVVASAGSAIPAPVVTAFLDRFGDVLFNIYGSTEVSWATVATPADLRQDARSAGRPPRGTRLWLDPETADVWVGNDMLFEGYTRGEAPAQRDGMFPTGDRGHLLPDGCLVIDGRSDDMVISGGENVYPRQTEDVIAAMPGVVEVAVIGVSDADLGQRLAAWVVGDVTGEAVIAWVKGRLARSGVPREVHLVEELPRNATGKVVPRELRR